MDNKAKVYSLLKNTPKNITVSPININNIQAKSPISNHCYLTSNNSPNRSKSPSAHLKTKIRLVSPQRLLTNSVFTPKENNPPVGKLTKSHRYSEQCASPQLIELGGKTAHFVDTSPKNQRNQASNVSIMNHIDQNNHLPLKNQNIGAHRFVQYVPPPALTIKSPILSPRQVSPQKICFNNKTFDIGAIKSQIVYVNPHCQRREIEAQYTHYQPIKRIQKTYSPMVASCSPSHRANQVSHTWPSELVIQQENNLEELKETYESELKEIKQLQQQIHQNNIQIKELLKSSRVSKHTHSSKHTVDAQEFCESVEIFTNQFNAASSHPNFRPTQITLVNKHSQSSEENHEKYQQTSPRVNPSQRCPFSNKKQSVAINSQQSLINELNFMTSHKLDKKNENSRIKRCKDEASVQTEENGLSILQQHNLSKNDSKYQKFTITRNSECQVKMVMCSPTCKAGSSKKLIEKEKVVQAINVKEQVKNDEEEKQKGLNLYSQPSLVYLFKSQEYIAEKEPSPRVSGKIISVNKAESGQKIIEEIIPVSQQSISSVRAQNTEFRLQKGASEYSIKKESSSPSISNKQIKAINSQQRNAINKSEKDNQSAKLLANSARITELQEAIIEDVIRNKISQAKIPSAKSIEGQTSQKSAAKITHELTLVAETPLPSVIPIPAVDDTPQDLPSTPIETRPQLRKFSNRIYL